jgi:acyl-CoA synthetase (NDP forming)
VAARGVGVSHYISSGNEASTTFVDYLRYLGEDEETDAILAYAEGFRDGRALLTVARAVTERKPLILLKAGETDAGASAAMSHTAVLSGSDAVVDAVCRQAGIVRVRTIEDVVDAGVAFAGQPLPSGPRVAVLTAAGGYGVLIADAVVRAGLRLSELGEDTLRQLDSWLPSRWPRQNPVDKSGVVSAESDRRILEILAASEDVDAILTLGVPIGRAGTIREERVNEYVEFLRDARRLANAHAKPILTMPTWSLLLPDAAADLTQACRQAGVASYSSLGGLAVGLRSLALMAGRRDEQLANLSA